MATSRKRSASGAQGPVSGPAPGSAPAEPPVPAVVPAPAFYVATGPLYVGGGQGSFPARAFNAGDRVPADLVAVNGWGRGVKVPDDYEPPAPAAQPTDDDPDQGGAAQEDDE